MSFYSHYRGLSLGRLLHAIHTYCKYNSRVCEGCTLGDGKITYYNKIIATYTWEGETDTPIFVFTDECGDYKITYEKRQLFLKPYLDSILLDHIEWYVQKIRETLTFDEALLIRHCREHFPNNFSEVIGWKKLAVKIDSKFYEVSEK